MIQAGDRVDNVLSQVAAIILAVMILFVAPAYRISWLRDQEVYKYVSKETSQFVNNVRLKGFVSKENLELFLSELNKTNNTYDVQIVHTQKAYYPSGSDAFQVVDDKHFTREILEKVYNKGEEYPMKAGDNFEVVVVNRSRTGSMVFSSLLGGSGDTMIFARYGGAIQNEDY